jgi:hypothetical protein
MRLNHARFTWYEYAYGSFPSHGGIGCGFEHYFSIDLFNLEMPYNPNNLWNGARFHPILDWVKP